ncbi:MAG: YggT family protein [Omnitrophica WOR_2 bacterium]
MGFLLTLIYYVQQLLVLVIIIKVFLSYFMAPYHPVRMFFDRLVEPMLVPIRRILPSTGMIDFSPMVLILLVIVIGSLLSSLFRAL